jgi:hypothetical protein
MALPSSVGRESITLLSVLAQYLHFMTVCSLYGAFLFNILPDLWVFRQKIFPFLCGNRQKSPGFEGSACGYGCKKANR